MEATEEAAVAAGHRTAQGAAHAAQWTAHKIHDNAETIGATAGKAVAATEEAAIEASIAAADTAEWAAKGAVRGSAQATEWAAEKVCTY